jgi:hypothetical protein
MQASAECGKLVVRCNEVGQAEVCNLDVFVLVEKQIFRLEIAVYNKIEVTILKCRYNLGI